MSTHMQEDFDFQRDYQGNVAGVDNQFFGGRTHEDDEFAKQQIDNANKITELQRQMDNKNLPSEMRDRARYGGNYLAIKDENKPPYSPFYVFVSGHVESGQVNHSDGICCKYDFVAGTDWQIVEGNRSGVSQHSYKSQQTNKKVVWNYPFELALRSYNVTGWPQIVITLTQRDFFGRDVICAYGTTNVPTQPGIHTRYIHLFAPISSSLLSDFFGWIKGKPAEYISPTELLSKNEGREVTRVVSAGTVTIKFQITMKNMDEFGIYPFKA